MQPESHQPIPQGPEQQPMQPVAAPEAVPSLPPIEARIGYGQEAFERRAESPVAAQSVGAPQPMMAPQPVMPQAPVQPAAPVQASVSPMVAADEDLIEKEWVDKAKDIIRRTADDPFTRSAQVSTLQQDYLQKRYGKTLGTDA